jgi:uncharacterized protein (DUF302 family)
MSNWRGVGYRQRKGNAVDQLDYTVTTEKGFDETVVAVEAGTAAQGFRVLHVHDVQATLGQKGFAIEPMKIVEICNSKFASQVLAQDKKISLMLPCPISVYVDKGRTFVSAMRPSLLASFYPHASLAPIAAEVERIILTIVDGAK